MKKVCIISSSFRKEGNSDLLCDAFMKGALEVGNEVEKFFLADYRIAYCSGCSTCFTTGRCSQRDDMDKLLEQMIISDVIVLATPVYFFSMSGQLKNFIDRCCARSKEIVNKEFYYLMSANDTGAWVFETLLQEFNGFLSCLNGAKQKGYIEASGVFDPGDVKQTEMIEQAYTLGKTV